MIRLILNILWLIFGSGIVLALGYALAGIICFLLVITIPFGVAAFRLANYSLWRSAVRSSSARTQACPPRWPTCCG